MGKPDQGSAAAEGARRATGDAADPGRGGRLSVGRKREVVLRLLRGEDLESVSVRGRWDHRGAGLAVARPVSGRGPGQPEEPAADARNEDDRRLQAKIGELLMENE